MVELEMPATEEDRDLIIQYQGLQHSGESENISCNYNIEYSTQVMSWSHHPILQTVILQDVIKSTRKRVGRSIRSDVYIAYEKDRIDKRGLSIQNIREIIEERF